MRRLLPWWTPWALLVASLASASPARAQDAGSDRDGVSAPSGSPDAAAPQIRPPLLLRAVDPVYPEEARQQRLEAVVGVRLTIDVHGRVIAAEVAEPAGHGFDEAARTAALGFTFTPAMRGEEPMAARVLCRVVFALPKPPPAAQPAPPSAAAPPAPPPPPPVDPAPPTLEVTVHGSATPADQLRHSAEAVTVVDTRQAKGQTADLGEVLARTQGVAVRREAGLGSVSQLSLNGLYDDQIRYFIDGLPLELAGFPAGVANVPVNVVDRVDIYRGVVPIRFGADALGGAVNLISNDRRSSYASASDQIGSFGTERATLAARYQDRRTGLFVAPTAFVDYAKNDYDVHVSAADAQGQLRDVTVPRFHDRYRALGAFVEGGVVDRPWAERLSVRAGYSWYDKQLQSNAVMTLPYGEVTYGERVLATSARYEQPLSQTLRVDLLGAYARRVLALQDLSQWIYDWFGDRIRHRRTPGEIDSQPHDDIYWENDVYARGLFTWTLSPDQVLRLSSALTDSERTGQDRALLDPTSTDPLAGERRRLTVVSGVEWQLDAWGRRIENVAFAKSYVFRSSYEQVLASGAVTRPSQQRSTFGAGDALRVLLRPWLYLKASYEYATRFPSTYELFGNGVLIGPSPNLEPEVSHNGNVGPRVEVRHTAAGDLTADLNAFLRDSDRLIVLLGTDQFLSYQNVYRSRSRGVEGEITWVTPRRFLTLDATATYQDLRNASSMGTFGAFEGDRIPNRPWLFASFGARGHVAVRPERRGGLLEPFYVGRYVHSFLRGWESVGTPTSQQAIPAQLSHDVGLSYSFFFSGPERLRATFEIDNVGNALLFDSYGAQRPGRAFYLKVVADLGI